MTKTQTALAISLMLFFTLFAAAVHADGRSSSRERTTPTVTPPPTTIPTPTPIAPPQNNGGISNNTSIEVDSGGNSGGKVTTGNQSGTLIVVNEGPTNSNNVVSNIGNTTPSPAPVPACEPSRTNRCDQEDARNR